MPLASVDHYFEYRLIVRLKNNSEQQFSPSNSSRTSSLQTSLTTTTLHHAVHTRQIPRSDSVCKQQRFRAGLYCRSGLQRHHPVGLHHNSPDAQRRHGGNDGRPRCPDLQQRQRVRFPDCLIPDCLLGFATPAPAV